MTRILIALAVLFAGTSLAAGEVSAEIWPAVDQVATSLARATSGELATTAFTADYAAVREKVPEGLRREFCDAVEGLMTAKPIDDTDPYLRALQARVAVAFHELSTTDVARAAVQAGDPADDVAATTVALVDRYRPLLDAVQHRIIPKYKHAKLMNDSTVILGGDEKDDTAIAKEAQEKQAKEALSTQIKQQKTLRDLETLLIPSLKDSCAFVHTHGHAVATYDPKKIKSVDRR